MITITLTLPESAAAALWDDVTWGGNNPRDLADIAQTILAGRAAIAETHLPAVAMPSIVAKFKAAHPHHYTP
jgi:hypothetical protein